MPPVWGNYVIGKAALATLPWRCAMGLPSFPETTMCLLAADGPARPQTCTQGPKSIKTQIGYSKSDAV